MATFDWDALAEAGIESVVVEYHGEGDEGYIEEITASPEAKDEELMAYRSPLYDSIQSSAYDLLEQEWGGWEINEGSSGTITLDVATRVAELNHGETRHIQHWTKSSHS